MTLIRRTPPCDDPACQPCWWDALDREMFAALPPRLMLIRRLRKGLRDGARQARDSLERRRNRR